MKYYCYNCSTTPCTIEFKQTEDEKHVPFMCPWCKVERFATWIVESHLDEEEIVAIDPGNAFSAFVILNSKYEIKCFAKIGNDELLELIKNNKTANTLVVECISSYGMPVGAEVFETCVWIGRFMQASNCKIERLYRKEVKLHLCNSVKAKDSNIIQALKDRFGDKGTVKNKGYFYGFAKDIWQAFAVAVTYLDRSEDEDIETNDSKRN